MVLELLTFLGLALLVEGILLALFPEGIRRMMVELSGFDGTRLRAIGLIFAGGAALLLMILARVWGDDGGTVALGFPQTRDLIAALF